MGENTNNEQSVCVKKPRSGDLLVKSEKSQNNRFGKKQRSWNLHLCKTKGNSFFGSSEQNCW